MLVTITQEVIGRLSIHKVQRYPNLVALLPNIPTHDVPRTQVAAKHTHIKIAVTINEHRVPSDYWELRQRDNALINSSVRPSANDSSAEPDLLNGSTAIAGWPANSAY